MKKKVKNLIKKVEKTVKAVNLFLKQCTNNYKSMKTKINKIWLFAIFLALCSCGSTKVSVDRPSAGTQTTITVTTNNPITTEVNPTADLNLKGE